MCKPISGRDSIITIVSLVESKLTRLTVRENIVSKEEISKAKMSILIYCL
jgi:hypothetical protein